MTRKEMQKGRKKALSNSLVNQSDFLKGSPYLQDNKDRVQFIVIVILILMVNNGHIKKKEYIYYDLSPWGKSHIYF